QIPVPQLRPPARAARTRLVLVSFRAPGPRPGAGRLFANPLAPPRPLWRLPSPRLPDASARPLSPHRDHRVRHALLANRRAARGNRLRRPALSPGPGAPAPRYAAGPGRACSERGPDAWDRRPRQADPRAEA